MYNISASEPPAPPNWRRPLIGLQRFDTGSREVLYCIRAVVSGKRRTIAIHEVSGDVRNPTEDDLIGNGGFGSVYSSEMKHRGRVALKRLYSTADLPFLVRRFTREMAVCTLCMGTFFLRRNGVNIMICGEIYHYSKL
ncbi:hypothetical protein BOTBODRAFT_609567 [Botryobasidium botryosum FD-172 SS1]|uniref:Protein kinase domain-containing protein n=1 Tax=Botryobasidium botryosum (strain FD-172 SS1) TaxID=930990 RepID=A0A067LWE9_BOTB1|nr:hypothetical protein BOTBODRAFT_609567 [Botryobasidium botryosum FD-172 SS1]